MAERATYDAVVVGAGPNGLAAAITFAQAGHSVLVLEARDTIGGGMRTAELTLPGFKHDVCSAVQPLCIASPFLSALPLTEYGLSWIEPPAALAHPLENGRAAVLERSIAATSATLGRDAEAYAGLMTPLVRDWPRIIEATLGSLHLPHHPLALARFGLHAIRSGAGLARAAFDGPLARGLFAGLAAHSMLPLEELLTAGFALMLAMAGHAVGWPIPRGGSQEIANALGGYLRTLGGEIHTGVSVESLAELPPARVVLFDLTPRQILRLAGGRLPPLSRRQFRHFRYGPGVFKIDYALDGPVPWRAPACARAGTVHLGGTLPEVARAEAAVARGRPPERPFVLLAQQSLFDASRAPAGQHTVWAYCHVPNGATFDMTARIEAQIERFAPGFRDRVLARHVMSPAAMEAYNPNYIGGDINGGIQDLRQFYTRPTVRLVPYRTGARGLYICSSATPPGGGVHGLCGYYAARAALRDIHGTAGGAGR